MAIFVTKKKRVRTPIQQRSQATVRAVLQAAAQIFCRLGYVRGTTNRIAECAGVSIGTLYQYFPNKQAILVALMESHIADATKELHAVLHEYREYPRSAESLLQQLASKMLEVHMSDPELHRILFEECPRPEQIRHQLEASESGLVDELASILENTPAVSCANSKRAAYFVASLIEGMTHRYAINRTPPCSASDFVSHLTSILVTQI